MSNLPPTSRVVRNLRKRGLTVLNHDQWGSRRRATYAARRVSRPVHRPADTCVQHITVTQPSGDFASDVRTVERIGYERFKSGVSYNWVVDMRTGEIAAGQPLDAKGTHTVNDKRVPGFSYDQNLVARAIAVVGMPGTPLSDKAEASIVAILAAMIEEGELTPGFDYEPHSRFAEKDCPCDATRDRMPAIRKAVSASGSPTSARPARRTRGKRLDAALWQLRKAKGKGNRAEAIQAAKQAIKSIPLLGRKS